MLTFNVVEAAKGSEEQLRASLGQTGSDRVTPLLVIGQNWSHGPSLSAREAEDQMVTGESRSPHNSAQTC